MNYGGLETLESYRRNRSGLIVRSSGAQSEEDTVPVPHQQFLRNLPVRHQDANGIYVHAGMDPDLPLDRQRASTALWDSTSFIDDHQDWGKVVVFGHTYQREPPGVGDQVKWRPMNRPEKIGLDTGAAQGGRLTAVVLPEREFVSVAAPG